MEADDTEKDLRASADVTPHLQTTRTVRTRTILECVCRKSVRLHVVRTRFFVGNKQGLDIYGTAGRFSSTSLAPVNKYLTQKPQCTVIQKRLSNLNETRVRVLFET
jgi:hypothetical protein